MTGLSHAPLRIVIPVLPILTAESQNSEGSTEEIRRAFRCVVEVLNCFSSAPLTHLTQ